MPKFGRKSLKLLATAHQDLQAVCNDAIQRIDFSVSCGHRTPSEQMALFKKGRVFDNGKWIKSKGAVTDKDGTIRKSKHNYSPSLAVDLLPYPFKGWNNLAQFHELKKEMFISAEKLGIKLVWGADWDGDGDIAEHTLQDYPHFELKA